VPAHAANPLREARVGLITTCLVLGATAVCIALSTIRWKPEETYQLAFRVNQDATGIEVGTPVRMGGIDWGRVTRVSRGEIPAEGSLSAVAQPGALTKSRGTLVEFALDSRLELWPDAKVTRVASILGGDVHLVVVDTGLTRGSVGALALKTREAVGGRGVLLAWEGSTTVPALVGTRLASRLERLPEDWLALKAFLGKELPDSFDERREVMERGFEPLRDHVRADIDAWTPAIERVNADFASVREQFSGSDGVVASVERGWKAMEPDIDAIRRDFEEVRDRIERQTQPRLLALADRAEAEWRRTTRVWSRLSEAGGETLDTYGDFMADSSLMAGQLSHSMDDGLALLVRLLFGKPGEDGMARLERFDAASRLAVALGDLRCANDAMLAIAEGTEPVDPAMASRLREAASRAVARFRSAIDRLNQLWQRPGR